MTSEEACRALARLVGLCCPGQAAKDVRVWDSLAEDPTRLLGALALLERRYPSPRPRARAPSLVSPERQAKLREYRRRYREKLLRP